MRTGVSLERNRTESTQFRKAKNVTEKKEIADRKNTFVFTGKPISITVKKDNSLGIIKGVIKSRDGQKFIQGAKVLINADTTIVTNENGIFKIVLPEKMRVKSLSESYKLTISKDGFKTVSHYFFPKTHAEFSIQKKK